MLTIAIASISGSAPLDLHRTRDGPILLRASPPYVEIFAEPFCEDNPLIEEQSLGRQWLAVAPHGHTPANVRNERSATDAGKLYPRRVNCKRLQ